jgi:plastocyanin
MVRKAAVLLAAGAAMLFVFATTSSPVAGQGGGGTIVGHVHYVGPAPVNALIRMGADPRCNKLYAGKRPTAQAFVVGADGAMANVFVNVDGSFPNSPVPATSVELDQKDCQYGPHVMGARIGQTLQVKNEDPTEHNIHSVSMVGNDFNTTQLINGPTFEFKLKAGEMLHVRCDNHTWMSAFIGIMDNPYFAVSGTEGTFTINNVPAGKQTVKAWHEVMGTQTQMVDVQAGKTTTVDFTFMPGQKPAAGASIHELVIPHDVQVASIIASR